MKIITAHRETVAKLEKAMDRLLEMERLLHDTRSESWRLRSHFTKANEIMRGEAQEKIAEYEQEIALMTGLLATPDSTGEVGAATIPPAGIDVGAQPAKDLAAATAG